MFASTIQKLSMSPTTQPSAKEGTINFLNSVKKLMQCQVCLILSPLPYTAICESGHVHCDRCIMRKKVLKCPVRLPKKETVISGPVDKAATGAAQPEQGEICGKAIGENRSHLYKKIFDITKHYCGFTSCLATARGDRLRAHAENCAFATFIRCQLSSVCKTKSVWMKTYASHLHRAHQIPLMNLPVSNVRVPVGVLTKYHRTTHFVTNLFQVSGEFFGLTFSPKEEDYCIMICAIPTFRRVEKRFTFKLILRGVEGTMRLVVGRVGTLSEAADTAKRGGDFIRIGRAAMKSGVYAYRGKIVFEVTIMDTEHCALIKWDDSSRPAGFGMVRRIVSGFEFTQRGRLGLKEMLHHFMSRKRSGSGKIGGKKKKQRKEEDKNKEKAVEKKGHSLLHKEYRAFCAIAVERFKLMMKGPIVITRDKKFR